MSPKTIPSAETPASGRLPEIAGRLCGASGAMVMRQLQDRPCAGAFDFSTECPPRSDNVTPIPFIRLDCPAIRPSSEIAIGIARQAADPGRDDEQILCAGRSEPGSAVGVGKVACRSCDIAHPPRA